MLYGKQGILFHNCPSQQRLPYPILPYPVIIACLLPCFLAVYEIYLYLLYRLKSMNEVCFIYTNIIYKTRHKYISLKKLLPLPLLLNLLLLLLMLLLPPLLYQLLQIFLDGVDTRTVSLESLRNRISVVPQDTSLFDETVEYNLR